MIRLLKSPAYRLGRVSMWGNGWAALFFLLVAGYLSFISTCGFIAAASTGDPSLFLREPEFGYACLGIIVLPAMASCWAGAQAFACERSHRTMEQFVALPLSRSEVIFGRSLAVMAPILPALAVSALGTPVVLHFAAPAQTDGFYLAPPLLGWLCGWGIGSTALLSFCLGLYSGLRTTTTTRARLLAFLLLFAAFLGDVLICLLGALLFAIPPVGLAVLLCTWHVMLSALIITHCIRKFDVLILNGLDRASF